MKKKVSLCASFMLVGVFLTGCGITEQPITAETASGIWEYLFVLPLASLINLLHRVLADNLGFAIIGATFIVRLVLIPIHLKSMKSSATMQIIQPEIQRIQQKYAGHQDLETQQKMQKELTALYQAHDCKPMAGCLLPILQMIIFIAFYQAIYRHPLILDAHTTEFFGINLGVTGGVENVILGILVAGLSYVTQRLSKITTLQSNTSPGSEMMARMMKMMTLYLPVMMFTMVVGTSFALGLYFVTGAVMTIVQSLIFKRPTSLTTSIKKDSE